MTGIKVTVFLIQETIETTEVTIETTGITVVKLLDLLKECSKSICLIVTYVVKCQNSRFKV
jgi:hypothetical protein